MKFSEQLKQERGRLGLTQAEAAALLNIPDRTYWEWEHAKTEPWTIAQEGAMARLRKAKAKK